VDLYRGNGEMVLLLPNSPYAFWRQQLMVPAANNAHAWKRSPAMALTA